MAVDTNNYSLTFSDEFTGSYLNTSVWGTKYWWGGRTLSSNGEMQYFADRSTAVVQTYPELDPFRITADPTQPGDGVLTITAQLSRDTSLTDGLPYVSGLINTYGTFSQTYGYFEISAQVPSGQGLWPAFWLLPQSGAWPPEIDVLELLGHEPSAYYVGSHWKDATGKHAFKTEKILTGLNLSDGFHTYGTLWTADRLTYYLDGKEVFYMSTPPGVTEPMYLLAGLAVGGNWPGAPNEATEFPAEFQIDYIKAYAPTIKPTIEGDRNSNSPVATHSNDVIFTYDGDDTLEGLGGNDTLAGGTGIDVFLYKTVSTANGAIVPTGHDVILDFNPISGDVVRITKAIAGQKNFSGLYRMIKDNADRDAVLKLADGGSVTFDGISKAQLKYDDFLIV